VRGLSRHQTDVGRRVADCTIVDPSTDGQPTQRILNDIAYFKSDATLTSLLYKSQTSLPIYAHHPRPCPAGIVVADRPREIVFRDMRSDLEVKLDR
jgi:hypothetical protein